MGKRGNKKSQFYLIAAVIIMLIIFGVFSASSYLKKPREQNVVYDLNKELGLESGKVVDFAIYNKNESSPIIENWTKTYVDSMETKGVEKWVFVFGDERNITILVFNKGKSGVITIDAGGTSQITLPGNEMDKTTIESSGGTIQVKIGEITYEFAIKKYQNFGMIIRKGGYIVTSEGTKEDEKNKTSTGTGSGATPTTTTP
jgi:hypothetical protein